MDIQIEYVAGDPPIWKVFLGTFFWSCTSRDEAEAWAANAAAFVAENKGPSYQLPAPLTAIAADRQSGGKLSEPCYGKDVVDGSTAC